MAARQVHREAYDAIVQGVGRQRVIHPLLQRAEPLEGFGLHILSCSFDVAVFHGLADFLADDRGQIVHRDFFGTDFSD